MTAAGGGARRYGSDYIVELLTQAGIDRVAFNPGATFRGIHDSLVNGPQPRPEIVLCTHEGISVAVAQGFAKATGRPMAVLLHDVVGLQHATMAIYNAWCDRVPMILLGGAGPMAKSSRRPWIDWIHTASSQAELVRDYVKWDDQPADVASIGESFARAWTTAVASPPGPVYLCLDVELQECELGADPDAAAALQGIAVPSPPALATDELAGLADLLRRASTPVLVAGHVATGEDGFRALASLAETTASAVIDDITGMLSFATDHPLNASGVEGVLASADAVILLDVDDVTTALGGQVDTTRVETVHVSTGHLRLRSWSHDYQQLVPGVRVLTAAADEAVRDLCDELARAPVDPALLTRRRAALDGIAAHRARWRDAAACADDVDAVPLERMVSLVGDALAGLADRPWRVVTGTLERWEQRLWSFTAPRQHLGWHAGGGLGYGPGAAIGGAIGSAPETVCVALQPDGDFLFTPSALWTLAHLQLPVLTVMHNNRQYRNTVEHAAAVARAARGRPVERRHVGATLGDPPVDFAALARSFGIWAAGPVTDAGALEAALAEAMAVVTAGQPALVDVVTPGA